MFLQSEINKIYQYLFIVFSACWIQDDYSQLGMPHWLSIMNKMFKTQVEP